MTGTSGTVALMADRTRGKMAFSPSRKKMQSNVLHRHQRNDAIHSRLLSSPISTLIPPSRTLSIVDLFSRCLVPPHGLSAQTTPIHNSLPLSRTRHAISLLVTALSSAYTPFLSRLALALFLCRGRGPCTLGDWLARIDYIENFYFERSKDNNSLYRIFGGLMIVQVYMNLILRLQSKLARSFPRPYTRKSP